MLIWILIIILAIPISAIVIGWAISAPRYEGAISDHFDGKQFFNPSGQNAKGASDAFKWQTSKREKTPWAAIQDFEFGEKPATDFGNIPKSDIPNPTSNTPSIQNAFSTN